MSSLESTANAHGATLNVLARLRREGWPETCGRCAGPIDCLRDAWIFTMSDERDPLLLHLRCPRPPLTTPICPEDPDVTMYKLADGDPEVRSERKALERILERLQDGEGGAGRRPVEGALGACAGATGGRATPGDRIRRTTTPA